jgi:hypothetical protein
MKFKVTKSGGSEEIICANHFSFDSGFVLFFNDQNKIVSAFQAVGIIRIDKVEDTTG